MSQRSILITGCSDDGLGSALALSLHKEGWRVFASARNVTKMSEIKASAPDIERVQLDVTSADSIRACIATIEGKTGGTLDCLLLNAGKMYSMPIVDLELDQVRSLFETNTFAVITVTTAFLPLLLKSTHRDGAMIVCNSSIVSIRGIPFQSAYNASKAASSSLFQGLRMELMPFNIRVIEMMTGTVNTNIWNNGAAKTLPPDSIYAIAKEDVEKVMVFEGWKLKKTSPPAGEWADNVVKKLSMRNPPVRIWEGQNTFETIIFSLFPLTWSDWVFKRLGALDMVEQKMKHTAESKKRI